MLEKTDNKLIANITPIINNKVLPLNTREYVDKLCASPEKAKEFLQRAGILEKEQYAKNH